MIVARRFFVHGARNEFLAGAGLAKDADTRFTRCHAINLSDQFFHRET
jgi:hypothetical protein